MKVKTKNKLSTHFSNFVKDAREIKGISQLELSKLSGVTRAQLWNIENKKANVKVDTVQVILKSLDVTVADFYQYVIDSEIVNNGM